VQASAEEPREDVQSEQAMGNQTFRRPPRRAAAVPKLARLGTPATLAARNLGFLRTGLEMARRDRLQKKAPLY